MKAVTICARNYLPYARVLGRSFLRSNPTASFAILLVDLLEGDELPIADCEVVGPWVLDLADDDLARMSFIYDVTELSTALKPWALDWALKSGSDVAVYLDPDIAVYDSLKSVGEAARRRGVALTPHRLTAMPRDGLRPTEADIMCSGIHNLGFIAVSSKGSPWLEFWKTRLLTDAVVDLPNQLFTDQRWTDWIPALFPYEKLDDPGLNVAYWNLDERRLEDSGSGPTCAGQPLRFFHFSGYRPTTPWCLSKYVADAPRVVISDYPALAPLLRAYDSELRSLGLYDPDSAAYRYGAFDDGSPVTPWLRRRYRTELLEARMPRSRHLEATEPPPPDHRHGFSNLREWLSGPSHQIVGISRLSYWIWASRTDLQVAFPKPQTESRVAFGNWLATYAVSEGYIPESWRDTVALPPATKLPILDEPGCNLFGYFSSVLGVGSAARALREAVAHAGLPATIHTSSRTMSQRSISVAQQSRGDRFPVNIVAMNADAFADWMDQWGREYKPGAHTIGYWFWELEDFPSSMHASLQYVDEIWTSSEFNADAYRAVTDLPVKVFPIPIEPSPRRPWPNLPGLTPTIGYFLFTFDYLSEVERKNPLGLIKAFGLAFPEQDGPALVIKSINGDQRRLDREKVRSAAGERGDIHLVEDYLGAEEMQALTQHAVAYVSLHRSEGLGLGMMEAMAQGTAVIATRYSGNLEFMNDSNSILIPCRQVEIGESGGYYRGLGHWADPDLSAAAAAMRSLHRDEALAEHLGEKAREDILSQFTHARAASFVQDRVREIFLNRDVQQVHHHERPRSQGLRVLYASVLRVPVVSDAARLAVAGAKKLSRASRTLARPSSGR